MNRGLFSSIDWHLIVPVIILSFFSLSTLFSINQALFRTQLFFFLFSFSIYLLFSHAHVEILRRHMVSIYLLSFLALILVLLLGSENKGAVRWVDVFGISIQFSEVLKPFLALSLAAFLSLHGKSIKSFIAVIFFTVLIALLIQKQPDLGNALIYISVSFLVMLYYGFNLLLFCIIGIMLTVVSPLFWYFFHDYQKERILTFINPANDPLGTSYNAIQSIIAVGSGMFWGRGLGEGTQSGLRFLPERHTDFIFATISEGFGFLGSALLITCFIYLLYRIYNILLRSEDKFCKLFCASVFFLLLVQVFFNIGMNVGVLPIVGITLPFVSYGGSSLLSNFIILGFISSLEKTFKKRSILEIK